MGSPLCGADQCRGARGARPLGRGGRGNNYRGTSRGGRYRYVYYAGEDDVQHGYNDSAAHYDDVRGDNDYDEMRNSFDGMSKNKHDDYFVQTRVNHREQGDYSDDVNAQKYNENGCDNTQ